MLPFLVDHLDVWSWLTFFGVKVLQHILPRLQSTKAEVLPSSWQLLRGTLLVTHNSSSAQFYHSVQVQGGVVLGGMG